MSTLYLGGALFRTGVGSLPGWGLRVSGERIEAVLPDDVLLADRVSGDEVVDVRGGLISPGFIDAHYHPTIGGLDLNACDLTPATSAEECLAIVAAYAAAHPEREWIVGAGWQVPWFPGGLPTAAMLDAVVPDRPVLLANADHHGHWANSAALPVTRQYVTDPLDPLLPEQALPLERAWTAYTAGSAWVNHLDHETGALVPGHLADLAILDGDPFAGPPHEISSHRVVRTVVGGETVHEA